MTSSTASSGAVIDDCLQISSYWTGNPERIREIVSSRDHSIPHGLRRLVLLATTNCNLDCSYCRVVRNFPPQDLSFQTVERVIRQAIPLGITDVHFTGGECTLVPWITDAIGWVRKKIGGEFYRVVDGQRSCVTCITPIHAPGSATVDREWKILCCFLTKNTDG
jgi:hypothetical protein